MAKRLSFLEASTSSRDNREVVQHDELSVDQLDVVTGEEVRSNTLLLPNVQPMNLNKLVKRPRYFDGNEPLPREWIEEYKGAMEDNCWSEQTAIFYFKHFLV